MISLYNRMFPPKNGDKIKITWFPNPRNNRTEKNCYIGSEGVVTDMDKDGFILDMGGALLLVLHNNYMYKKVA